MNYLHAYNISGSVIGIDINSWSIADLNGNAAFISTGSASVTNYTNISSIKNWENFGETAGSTCFEVRTAIEELYNINNTPWASYPLSEKIILAEKFIVDKVLRDEVLSQAEQDAKNHFILYHYLSSDVRNRYGEALDIMAVPKSLDYKKDLETRLHPEYTFDQFGFLSTVTYYKELSVTVDNAGISTFTYSTPVVEYSAVYTLGDSGYVKSRVTTRKWYRIDGTLDPDAKTSTKIYPATVARDEGRRRRKNLINNLLVDTVGLLLMTSGDLTTVSETETDAMEFMHDLDSAISAYYETGTKETLSGDACQLIQVITAHTYSRLDNWVLGTGDTVSIRMYILSRLDP